MKNMKKFLIPQVSDQYCQEYSEFHDRINYNIYFGHCNISLNIFITLEKTKKIKVRMSCETN